MNVLEDIATKRTDMKSIKPPPNLPSIPHMLVEKSVENIVERSRDNKRRKNPISIVLFKMVNLPSQKSLITSRPKIIIEIERINKDIASSVQSQGKGKIANGKRNSRALNKLF